MFIKVRKQQLALNKTNKSEYIANCARKMSRKMTLPEKIFKSMMKELDIYVIPQKIVCGKIYDFYEPKTNTLIEIDGNYFHGDEKLYEELSNMQKRNKKNDAYKDVLAKGLGYNIERIWELDLKNNYSDIKKKMKMLFLNT